MFGFKFNHQGCLFALCQVADTRLKFQESTESAARKAVEMFSSSLVQTEIES